MYQDSLQHHGIKGMKWGVRRTKAQLRRARGKTPSEKKAEKQVETDEQKRERLLKSTNPTEIYKGRNLLTTKELKDRIDRIDTERRIGELSAKSQKTAIDRINTALKYGNKINEVYQFTQTPVMKALYKQLFGTTPPEIPAIKKYGTAKKAYENRHKLSDKELNEIIKRLNAENALKKMADESSSSTPKKKDDEEEKK